MKESGEGDGEKYKGGIGEAIESRRECGKLKANVWER